MTALILALALAAEPNRISGDEIARTLQKALDGTQMHLDHDTPGPNGKMRRRSFIALPDTLGGKRYEFTVPDQVMDMGSMGQVTYRVNDINLSKVEVGTQGSAYVVSLFFEDDGKEVLAQHSGGMFDLGGTVPDVQMNNMRLDVALSTDDGGDAPAFSKAKVKFDADIKPDGASDGLAGALDGSTNYRRQIKDSIEREVQKTIDQVKLVEVLNAQLKALAKGRGAHFDGTDVVFADAREAGAADAEKPDEKPAKTSAKKKSH